MSDLINREELKKAMYLEAFENDSNEKRWDSGLWIRYKMFERILASVPSVPEQKKGKWTEAPDPYGFFETIPVCSECGCTTKLRETYKYCPNCGAEMYEEEQ